VEFSVPKQGPTAVRIFDLRGRQVAVLVNESLPAGVYRTRWNGRDKDGRDVASGLYFAMIEGAGNRQAVRLTLLK
jgi:flagellar hook assembly protein FlgD